ncbi:uncharacterized protein DDB_G0292186-like [Tetranychus urticae]|uniref:Uncharacterized protein n=1 Tax=Tetranychus urticae TaxID=32264 RepID=T1JQR4_TETUR|nr:uncharacterized protein DDB_G0292186-like [Tetranychus urticae]
MDESKPILPNWPFKGSPISSTSSSCSSTSTKPVLPTEQTKLPVKQRVVFPSDRTNTSFGTYSDNINNNKSNKFFSNNYNKNKNNDVKVKKHDPDIDDKQELRDGWEFDSQHYRNPSPPIAERISKPENFQKRRQDYSNRYNDRRNYSNNNHRGNGFNNYANRSNHKSNGDYIPDKRRRNDSFETNDTFDIDWSDCNSTTTNRTFNKATAATQTSPKVQHQATQSSQDCYTANLGPKKTTKDAILIDSWVRSLLGNNISYNQDNGQSNKNIFSADAGVRGDSNIKNGNSSRANIDPATEDYWAAELKDKAQVSSPKMDKPSVFTRLGKPTVCESDNFTSPETHFQTVKQLYPEKNQAAVIKPLFNDPRVNHNSMKTQLPQEIPPSHQLKQPQKSMPPPVISSQSQKTAEINIRDPRIRKRLWDAVTNESSLPKRQNIETPSDSIPLIPLIPLELVEEVHSSCQKTSDKKPLVIDLS